MKKSIFIIGTLLIMALNGASAQGIGAFLSHATFNVPGQSPYVEVYLEIIGNTIKYKQLPSGQYQGSILVTMIVKQDSVIKDFKKYELLSATLQDTLGVGVNFVDQQRFSLPVGNYVLELSIADNNVNKEARTLNYPFSIEFPADKVSLSTVQLINSYTKSSETTILSKSGYDLVPMVDNFYPSDKNKLIFYSEIYNPKHTEGEGYLVSYYIESFENSRPLNSFAKSKREASKPVMIAFNEFDISKLPTGNYNVVVSVKDKTNTEVAAGSSFFQRSNPAMDAQEMNYSNVDITNSFVLSFTSEDTLREFIRSLSPIATEMEKVFIRYQLEGAALPVLQQYFQRFWESRNMLEPQREWEEYKVQVDKVNRAFSTQVKKGYETDMGHVYLKYGEPSTIQDVPFDASALSDRGSVPYQIWHYYSLHNGRERNKRFVFISSEVSVKDYTLVHSDAVGEIQNWNWQRQLMRDLDIEDRSYDDLRKDRSRSGTYYNNPY
jgi:GWxTD domain-containing protein